MTGVALPRFSLAERDRRYRAVRREMAGRGLDALLIPHHTGEWDNCQPDVRYLTCIGGGGTGAAAVFPLEGEPMAIVREPRRVAFWRAAQDWVADVRGTRDAVWSEALIQAVRDAGCESGRIGVVGLAGHLREPEGTISHGAFASIRRALAGAAFENATGFLHDLRMVKSAEEIAMIERAQACADAIGDALFETARVGVTEHELYAAMQAAHIRLGGETPSMMLIGIGRRPNQTFLTPTMRRLAAGDIILAECEPKYAGYSAQSVEAACLGVPADDYDRLYEASLSCFRLLSDAARPGMPYAELIRLWGEHMAGAGLRAAPTIGHGLGLGHDGPATRPGGDAQGHVIRAGHCLVLKPWATSADGARAIRAGGCIVVEEAGARRLGRREPAFRRLG